MFLLVNYIQERPVFQLNVRLIANFDSLFYLIIIAILILWSMLIFEQMMLFDQNSHILSIGCRMLATYRAVAIVGPSFG